MNFVHELAWRDLRRINRATMKPFQLALADSDDVLYCEEMLTVLPGKYLVAFGRWGGKAVVARLYYGRRHAARQAKYEYNGIKALLDAGVQTPAVYFNGTTKDKTTHVLIFERIQGYSLDQLWQARHTVETIVPLMQTVTLELATQHVLGVLQNCLDLKNFFIHEKHIYTLHGEDVEIINTPLDKRESLDNLGLFFAQLGVEADNLMQGLFQTYAKSRGWLIKKQDIIELKSAITKWSKKRWEHYSKTIMQSGTAFVRRASSSSLIVYDRDAESIDLLNCLKNPDTVFSAIDTVILKEDGTSTVAKIILNGRAYVIKRNNIKNSWHALRRCFRPTRAAKGWQLGRRLALMGISTAKPVAFIEKRFLGLRGRSYLIMEHIESEHVGEYFSRENAEDPEVAKKIIALFENLAKMRLTHGDLKMTNILITHHNPVLIDLDGMQEHRTVSGLKRAYKQEMERFMKNWRSLPKAFKLFDSLIKKD